MCRRPPRARRLRSSPGEDGQTPLRRRPLQPTPGETKKAYEPFFKYLAGTLNRDHDLVATTDWAGISVALANKQVDLAWMGPWGYVLANDDSGALATAYADRLIALREGELVEDPPISRFDSRTLEQIYEREGEHRRGVTG